MVMTEIDQLWFSLASFLATFKIIKGPGIWIQIDRLDLDDHVLIAFAIAICSLIVFISILPALVLTIKNQVNKNK